MESSPKDRLRETSSSVARTSGSKNPVLVRKEAQRPHDHVAAPQRLASHRAQAAVKRIARAGAGCGDVGEVAPLHDVAVRDRNGTGVVQRLGRGGAVLSGCRRVFRQRRRVGARDAAGGARVTEVTALDRDAAGVGEQAALVLGVRHGGVHPRQHRVQVARAREPQLGYAALCDVVDRRQRVTRAAVRRLHVAHLELGVQQAAIRPDVPFAEPVALDLAGEHCRELLHVRVEVVGISDLRPGLAFELVPAVSHHPAELAVHAQQAA